MKKTKPNKVPVETAPYVGRYPITPDGRYFVVRGRLWRCSDPGLSARKRETLVSDLMKARRLLARRAGLDAGERRVARASVNAAKVALGERGPVWWRDGAPDYNRKMAENTPYRDWFRGVALGTER